MDSYNLLNVLEVERHPFEPQSIKTIHTMDMLSFVYALTWFLTKRRQVKTMMVASEQKVTERLCAMAQPPLEEVPEGDWYCPTCATDGRERKRRTRKKAAPKQATPPLPKARTGNRALAAMLGDDEDSDADGAVTVKVPGPEEQVCKLPHVCPSTLGIGQSMSGRA